MVTVIRLLMLVLGMAMFILSTAAVCYIFRDRPAWLVIVTQLASLFIDGIAAVLVLSCFYIGRMQIAAHSSRQALRQSAPRADNAQ